MVTTACLRGEEPRNVRTRVVRLEDYVASQQAAIDEDEAAHFEAVVAGWALLGLQRERDYSDVVDAYYATVGAFYDSRADTITILHRGSPLDSDAMIATLVHEFSHALQYDAPGEDAPAVAIATTDTRLARSAIFEGDATRTTDHAVMRMFGADPKGPNWRNVYDKWRETETANYADEELRLTLAGRYFVYAFGARFAENVAATSGANYLERIYAWMDEPPLSTRALMVGPAGARGIDRRGHTISKRWVVGTSRPEAGALSSGVDAGAGDAGATHDAGEAADSDSVEVEWRGPELLLPALPEHRLLDADSIGKFVLDGYATYVEGLLGDADRSLRWAAESLVSDSLTVWQAEGRTVVIFRAQFSSASRAESWLQAFDLVNPGPAELRAGLDGNALIVISSDDEAWLSAFALDELEWFRYSPAELAAELAADAGSNAALWADRRQSWRSRFSRGCVPHPGAMLRAGP